MTIQEALRQIREVGTIRVGAGRLKLRFPESERVRLEPAIEALRQNRETVLRALAIADLGAVAIPPAAQWPESISELATEVGQRSGDIEAARREVWTSWYEWKAAALNRLFQDQGATGQLGRITAATVRHGERLK